MSVADLHIQGVQLVLDTFMTIEKGASALNAEVVAGELSHDEAKDIFTHDMAGVIGSLSINELLIINKEVDYIVRQLGRLKNAVSITLSIKVAGQ